MTSTGEYSESSRSVLSKMQVFISSIPISTWFSGIIVLSAVILISGFITEGFLSVQSVLLSILVSIGMYMWFKNQYSKSLAKCHLDKSPTMLDSLCQIVEEDTNAKEVNKNICKQYGDNKRNFYSISNLLLQQYIV